MIPNRFQLNRLGHAFLKFVTAKNFGLVIGVIVACLVLLFSEGTVIVRDILEVRILDFNFRMKTAASRNFLQDGVVLTEQNPNISRDIVIVGVDDRSLSRLGRWPFPRHVHSTFVDNFSLISDQKQRENSLFLDFFFIEPDQEPEDDIALINSIESNNRVFLETALERTEQTDSSLNEMIERQRVLNEYYGEISSVNGDWLKINSFRGSNAPLKPYSRVIRGYGHANFIADPDEVFRRQPLVIRLLELVQEINLDELTAEKIKGLGKYDSLEWRDTEGFYHEIALPITSYELANLREEIIKKGFPKSTGSNTDSSEKKDIYFVRHCRNVFVPSISLSLAANYFNIDVSDIEINLDQYILLKEPQVFNTESGVWEPYNISKKDKTLNIAENASMDVRDYKITNEIRIPIDSKGQMIVNFVGSPSNASHRDYQTFPVRSYSSYAISANNGNFPRSKGVANKIVMSGAFSKGMAADEKPTPVGMMYGVEIHANALNTIIMNNFLKPSPVWLNIGTVVCLTLLVAFMASRLGVFGALVSSVLIVIFYFVLSVVIFDVFDFILEVAPAILGVVVTFVAVVAYRVVTEEKDKARIREMFGKYVSPAVVDEILSDPPELGGVTRELTVFFSDIRGFTSLSENMQPQELVTHLNVYLGKMTDVLLEYQGTLDKYVGDEIMCFWGAPSPAADHAFLACQCALRQMEELSKLNMVWPEEKRLNIGIGLNTGMMLVGNMGSPGRMNYTLAGDNVNLGSRLEGANKQYGTNVIISEHTYKHVKDRVVVRELDNIRVKGREKPVQIYELLDVVKGNNFFSGDINRNNKNIKGAL